MSQTMKTDPFMLGVVLVIGAMIWTRSNKANAATRPGYRPGTVPGNVGSGTKQIVGGILGSLFQSVINPQSKQWTTWEPFQGVDHDPASPSGFVAVTDIVNAGIENEPVYKVETVSDIFRDASNTDTFGARPGAYFE
jgi:hypothetical protein